MQYAGSLGAQLYLIRHLKDKSLPDRSPGFPRAWDESYQGKAVSNRLHFPELQAKVARDDGEELGARSRHRQSGRGIRELRVNPRVSPRMIGRKGELRKTYCQRQIGCRLPSIPCAEPSAELSFQTLQLPRSAHPRVQGYVPLQRVDRWNEQSMDHSWTTASHHASRTPDHAMR